jgi:hypothetical protein
MIKYYVQIRNLSNVGYTGESIADSPNRAGSNVFWKWVNTKKDPSGFYAKMKRQGYQPWVRAEGETHYKPMWRKLPPILAAVPLKPQPPILLRPKTLPSGQFLLPFEERLNLALKKHLGILDTPTHDTMCSGG